MTKFIYKIILGFLDYEKFGIISQIRRTCVSISNNLAEESGRITGKDQANFTTTSYSSLLEVLNLLIVSVELGYLDKEEYHLLRKDIEKISNKLNALRKSQLKNN